jgi:hypothetical protein
MSLRILILVVVLGLLLISTLARAEDLGEARDLIAKQLEQLKKGDVDGLKAGFTARQQDKITKALVEAAQKEVSKHALDDLVGSVAKQGNDLKIKMKNGRSLTTLVKVDGAWKADTIWFK